MILADRRYKQKHIIISCRIIDVKLARTQHNITTTKHPYISLVNKPPNQKREIHMAQYGGGDDEHDSHLTIK